MPELSIVLPTFNGEKYLKFAIESIIGQTFTDWELLIVDDCSMDSTPFIINEFLARDSRIKMIHNKENQKLPKSLNIGFSNSTGNYLTWTSDDNILLPNALETLYMYLREKLEYYMVKADMIEINENGENIGYVDTSRGSIWKSNNIGACFLYRREVFEEIGDYDESLFGVEDYDYWLRIVEKYGDIAHISTNLYKYRRHEGSLSSTKKKYINNQLGKLRYKHIDYILNEIKDNLYDLYWMYYDLLEKNVVNTPLTNIIKKELPHIIDEYKVINQLSNKEIVVFGAGVYGRKAKKMFRDKIKYFIDNNPQCVGQRIEQISVIDFESFIHMSDKYVIIVAVDKSKTGEIIEQLFSVGISQYVTYQFLETLEKGDARLFKGVKFKKVK